MHAAGSERCAGRAARCGAGINAALARRRRRRSGLAHRYGERNAGSVRAFGGRARSACERARPFPRRVGSAHRPIGGVGVHVHLDAGSWPSWSLSMLGARRIWSARHERPETARRSALTIPTAPVAWKRQRHALAASTVRGARPLPTGPVRQDGTTPACWEAGVIPSGTIKQSRLLRLALYVACEPRGTPCDKTMCSSAHRSSPAAASCW